MASLLAYQCRTLPGTLNKITLLKNANLIHRTVKLSQFRELSNLMNRKLVLTSRNNALLGTRCLNTLKNAIIKTVYKDAGQTLKPSHGVKRHASIRLISGGNADKPLNKADAVLYTLSLLVISGGLAYAGVPFFKMFCRQFGFGGNPELGRGHDRSKIGTMDKIEDREITVHFTADTHASMRWNFRPQQARIKVKPGETALAFYTAMNPTDKPIIGIATYTVNPYVAAPYFNKVQCFCFEEQILNPHEQVDMPVFFYIDPEYDEDPFLEFDDDITLSYTFFEAKEGWDIPLPGFIKSESKPTTNVQPS